MLNSLLKKSKQIMNTKRKKYWNGGDLFGKIAKDKKHTVGEDVTAADARSTSTMIKRKF